MQCLGQAGCGVALPATPSHFGISYPRIAWLRNVFQASSHRDAMVLVQVNALVREDQIGIYQRIPPHYIVSSMTQMIMVKYGWGIDAVK
jgi:hypothetical protein